MEGRFIVWEVGHEGENNDLPYVKLYPEVIGSEWAQIKTLRLKQRVTLKSIEPPEEPRL